ncbi:Na+/H+ antiporter subunit G [Thiohalocapsa marina]|uniref:Na+/H+ antiporter subunit G n=1 Tax=Thiohalocapsa marina TaxID=424902 RepID=A0A5M8FUK3_9GAMM|nr:Na+/H+ antiporter subunit G [Thiohalocapsa marina]KAA6187508.1 Na+/H+ antiporter subunit G [Thiohalocapsa marina]
MGVEILVSLLIVIGAAFTCLGSVALLRLRDFYSRLHGPTKATTLGVGSLLIASSIFFSAQGPGLSLHEILVALFLFITAPVGAHLMAKAALHLRVRGQSGLPPDALLDGQGVAQPDPQAAPRPVPRPASRIDADPLRDAD